MDELDGSAARGLDLEDQDLALEDRGLVSEDLALDLAARDSVLVQDSAMASADRSDLGMGSDFHFLEDWQQGHFCLHHFTAIRIMVMVMAIPTMATHTITEKTAQSCTHPYLSGVFLFFPVRTACFCRNLGNRRVLSPDYCYNGEYGLIHT